MSNTPAWTATDSKNALREGWGIFNEDEIQRDDEAGVFASDDEAIEFVRASNAPHARKARIIAGL